MDNRVLHLIRHGVTESQTGVDVSGSEDPPLSGAGLSQIQHLITCLDDRKPSMVYTSPLLRARQTAEIISGYFGCQTVEVPEMREIDIGDWDGLPLPEIRKRYPEEYDRWLYKPRNGESVEMLCGRVNAVLERILRDDPDSEVVYCATHGGPIRAALIASLDVPLANYWKIKIPHGSVTSFEHYRGQLILCSMGQLPLSQ